MIARTNERRYNRPKIINLSDLLSKVSIQASAPGRVDCGGTWDIKALALAKESMKPATVNIAINLRTSVRLLPHSSGRIFVHSEDFASEELLVDQLPFNTPLGLIFAILSHFGVSGVKVSIMSDIPVHSGLGGSGVMAVAVVGAICKALELLGHTSPASKNRIALMAHIIEDGLHISLTGLQDQLSAVYGGVNKWTWKYSCFERPYRRQEILKPQHYEELHARIVVAYTGETRKSSQATARYIDSFLGGPEQRKWMMIKQLVDDFSYALYNRQWTEAASALRQEAAVRDSILPEALTPLTQELREAACECDCGAAFAGGNRDGCIWAIGCRSSMARLKERWKEILQQTENGRLLPHQIASAGLMIRCIS